MLGRVTLVPGQPDPLPAPGAPFEVRPKEPQKGHLNARLRWATALALALLLTGQGLNTMSLIGVVILVGIVVNDAIVKVDFIVQAQQRGLGLRDAILEAGRVRLRPIVMTTVTTVLGLTPMAMGVGRGSDLRAPLAITVIGGLVVATVLTLIVVPVVYQTVEQVRERVREWMGLAEALPSE